MAGGSKRGSGLRTSIAAEGAPRRVRHVWVQHAGGEWAGVLTRWDQVEGRWLATVAWVEEDQSLRVERVPAARLRPAGAA